LATSFSLCGQSTRIEGPAIRTELDPVYRHAELNVEWNLGAGRAGAADEIAIEAVLLDDSGRQAPLEGLHSEVRPAGDGVRQVQVRAGVSNPRKWTAETPYLYTLALRLTSGGRVIQEARLPVGFRKVEVKGMRLLVNGVPIEIRGVVTTRSDRVQESDFVRSIRFLKESNVNALRGRGFSLDEKLLDLCDRHGIYVIADVPSAEPATAVYATHHNHPSVILWHVGAGSRPRTALADETTAARWFAREDPSRPVAICQSVANKDEQGTTITDLHYDPMSHPEFREINPTPVLFGEYHGVPEALRPTPDPDLAQPWGRRLQQEWSLIRDRYFYVAGGLICCWEQRALRPDNPLFRHVREAYAPIQMALQESVVAGNQWHVMLKVTNFYKFMNLDGYAFQWELRRGREILASGREAFRVAPGTSFQFPLNLEIPGGAHRLRVTAIDPGGYAVYEADFPLPAPSAPAAMAPSKQTKRGGETRRLEGGGLRVAVDLASGLPAQLSTAAREGRRSWLHGPLQFQVRNEVTRAAAGLTEVRTAAGRDSLAIQARLAPLPLRAVQRWSSRPGGLAWDLQFEGDGPRAGHEVTIDLPILHVDSQIFTPSNRGVMDVAARPTFKPPEYAHFGMFDGTSYVLPLVSVFDPKTDSALTIALPPDSNIPHLQFEWRDATILRMTLGHRGMGGGKPSPLRILFYSHAADYRAVMEAYSDDFPSYFRPPMPRNGLEGAFYYDPIEDHPPYDEMARQRVRYLWSSFWFTHVGEYLPPETEWMPYTFANWWRRGQKMSDEKIRSFIREMNSNGIRVFAFFNVDEYGGPGSYAGRNLHGDSPEIEEWRNARLRDALVKDAGGNDIPSWEGCKVLNADKRYSFFPHLVEQVKRHLARLPEIEGFLIDRMDWASILDYGHSDDLTMVGGKPAQNMALPIAGAVQEVCRLNHAAGKRVYINQFYRVEVLRDVDGFCHENDYPPALGYLTPYRPVSAWHWRKPYHGDLFLFESQLKRRLQFAVFPQMIAHDFPICQQEPDARAADTLEIFAPLFSTLIGKDQVLRPHPVAVTGANDVNLFVNGEKHYVAPVTSRVRFLSRRVRATEHVTLTLNVSDAAALRWAHVYRAEGPPYRASVTSVRGQALVVFKEHGSVSVVVVGKGTEPAFDDKDEPRLAMLRERLFPVPALEPPAGEKAPARASVSAYRLFVEGTQVGDPGAVAVLVDGKRVGEITAARGTFTLPEPPRTRPLRVTLAAPDEGVWFVPEHVELVAAGQDGKSYRVAAWTPEAASSAGTSTRELRLQLEWVK
jgi:hypothetical protein